jgi:4-hydroxy-tetrahydrodipicolinate reductase
MTNVAISGVAGRMGKCLVNEVTKSTDLTLVGGLVRPSSQELNIDLGSYLAEPAALGVMTSDRPEIAFESAEVIIDFTLPEVLFKHIPYYLQHRKSLVIGSTGLSLEQQQELSKLAKDLRVVYSPNMSLGVTVMLHLVEKAARNFN